MLFYDTHVKPFFDYSTYVDSLEPGAMPMSAFNYRNHAIREAWKNAPPDIRKEVLECKRLADMSLEELGDLEDDDKENGKRCALTRSNTITNSYAARGDADDNHTLSDAIPQGKSVSSGGASEASAVLGDEEASEGPTTLGNEGPSGNATVIHRETSCNEGMGEDKPSNDSDDAELKVLQMADQATSTFKSAMREALQMKKIDGRERYASSLCT